MTTVSLNLPEDLQEFVNGQADAGQYHGPADYIQALIERAKNGKDKLEALLIEGLDSVDPIPLDAEEWTRIRRDVEQQLSDEG